MTTAIGSPPPPPAEWTLLQTLAPSGVGTISSSALTAYDVYKVVAKLTLSANATISTQFNSDGGANYSSCQISNTTVSEPTAQTSIPVMNNGSSKVGYLEFTVLGKTEAVASGILGMRINSTLNASGASTVAHIGGTWTGGNGIQISVITLLASSGTFTGKVDIYGKNLV